MTENKSNLKGDRKMEYRVCTCCKEKMYDGFVIEDGQYYYCDKECMEKDGLTWEEYLELYDDGDGNSYWTHWY